VIVTQQGERELQLVLTDEEFAAFKRAQDLLAHVVRNGDPAVVVARALAHYATHLEKRRFGAKEGKSENKRVPRGRHVPAALRRAVAERDEHCCSFVSADGHRCGETRGLQIDHITPLAHGGETTEDNLRLLCAQHNRHEAAKRIGVDEVAAKREANERARVHERAAKQREERLARERAVAASHVTTDPGSPTGDADTEAAEFAAARVRARRQSDIDTVAALRWMGISLDEAQLAAERTKDLADGPTGKRVMVARRFCSTRFGRKQDFRRKPDDARSASAPAGANDHAA
ncbi:MAG: HNH endonuclease, partial [Candidatus Eisenbacteria bacterium]|nr:HNH endonuclease [Candidatus Eisenbacteria bacterium]